MRIFMRIVIGIVVLFSSIAFGIYLTFQSTQPNLLKHHLSFVPPEMQVSQVIYVEEETWGFGPGGNETGFIMYDLPSDIAQKVGDQGIEYLSSFPSANWGQPSGWQGKYHDWKSTPISLDNKQWFEIPVDNQQTSNPQLSNYINRYGFGIAVRPDVETIFNEVIAAPGSYYAYGRIGVIVVAPSVQKVFYVYVG